MSQVVLSSAWMAGASSAGRPSWAHQRAVEKERGPEHGERAAHRHADVRLSCEGQQNRQRQAHPDRQRPGRSPAVLSRQIG